MTECEWVVAVTVDQLPQSPFMLDYCTTVTDAMRWLAKVQEDARAVLNKERCPRQKTGALAHDIKRIRALVEREEF